jgi:hypothetical protein
MIIVYVAHPIGGDVLRNMHLVEEACGWIFKERTEVIPTAPYLMALKFLDDADPTCRSRGIMMNKEFFFRRLIDEVWLFGPRISNGMWEEIYWAHELGIPVVPMSPETEREYYIWLMEQMPVGTLIHIGVCGPGQHGLATFVGPMPDRRGVCVWAQCGLVHIEWGDLLFMTRATDALSQWVRESTGLVPLSAA